MFRLLVCGGRDYSNAKNVHAVLDRVHAKHPELIVIAGGAPGADTWAVHWAEVRGVHYAEVPAHWDTYKKKAGYLRNAAMLALQPQACVAFPGGPGTAMMVKLCREAGIPVMEVDKAV